MAGGCWARPHSPVPLGSQVTRPHGASVPLGEDSPSRVLDEGQGRAPWAAKGLGEPRGGHGAQRPATRWSRRSSGREGFARIPPHAPPAEPQALGSLHNPPGTRPGSRTGRKPALPAWPPGPSPGLPCPSREGPSLLRNPHGSPTQPPPARGQPRHPGPGSGTRAPGVRREFHRKSRPARR